MANSELWGQPYSLFAIRCSLLGIEARLRLLRGCSLQASRADGIGKRNFTRDIDANQPRRMEPDKARSVYRVSPVGHCKSAASLP